jgi:hypothetical protein
MAEWPAEEYVTVIGFNYFHAIVALLEDLESLGCSGPNEVQASVLENGFAVSIATLSVFVLESAVARAQYIQDVSPPRPVVDYLRSVIGDAEIPDLVEELFVLRDVIVHNHIWEATTRSVPGEPMRLLSASLRHGYGDKKFLRVVDMKTRRTRLLRLNAFPTRIWTRDAVLILKNVVRVLLRLEALDYRIFHLSPQIVKYQGGYAKFVEVVDRLRVPQDPT